MDVLLSFDVAFVHGAAVTRVVTDVAVEFVSAVVPVIVEFGAVVV